MAVFFEVADLIEPGDGEPFAVIRIDTDKRAGDGCECKIMSLHWSAEAAAKEAGDLRLVQPPATLQ